MVDLTYLVSYVTGKRPPPAACRRVRLLYSGQKPFGTGLRKFLNRQALRIEVLAVAKPSVFDNPSSLGWRYSWPWIPNERLNAEFF